MDTKKSQINTTLLGVVLILCLTSCPGPRVCPDATYRFVVTATFTPERDSIRMGDTLYLSSSFSTKLLDVNSGREVDYSNATKVGSILFVQEIPQDKLPIKDAAGIFKYVNKKGIIYSDATVPNVERAKQLTYQQSLNNYELLVGVVAQKKGVFCITIGDGFSVGRPSNGCDKASFDIRLTNTNQHLSYLATYLGTPVSPYSAQRGYCFKVY